MSRDQSRISLERPIEAGAADHTQCAVPATLKAQLIEALQNARTARRGPTPELENLVRAHARAWREAGKSIERVLIDVKALVREHTGQDEPIFTPKVVGWTVAGYFAGTSPQR
jgi:hypothetical protein